MTATIPRERTPAPVRAVPRWRRAAASPAAAPVLVGLLAFAIVEVGNQVPSVWYDEVATISSATRTWSQLLTEVQHVDAVHAVYYALMHAVFSVVGYSPFTLRLPSAVAVAVTAAVLVVVLRRRMPAVLGSRAGVAAVAAGVIYPLIPRVGWSGGEGRSYALGSLLAVVMTVALLRALERSSRRTWALYGAAVVVGSLVFVYLLLVVAAHAATVLLLVVLRRKRSGILWSFAMAAGAAALVLTPFLVLVATQGYQVLWIPEIGPETVRQVVVTQFFPRALDVVSWGCWLLIGLGAALMLRRARSSALALSVTLGALLPTAVLLIATAVYHPYYSPRYLTMSTPFVAVLLGVVVASLPVRLGSTGRAHPRLVAAAALIGLAAVLLPTLYAGHRTPGAKKHSNWALVAKQIGHERAQHPDDATAIIFGPVRYHRTATTRVIEYAYPHPFAGTTDVTLLQSPGESGRLWEKRALVADSLSRLEGQDVVYQITSVKRDRRATTAASLATIGWAPVQSWNLDDVNIVEYRPVD